MSPSSAGYPVTQPTRLWLEQKLRDLTVQIDATQRWLNGQTSVSGSMVPMRPTLIVKGPVGSGSVTLTADGAVEFTDVDTLLWDDLFTSEYRSHEIWMEIRPSTTLWVEAQFMTLSGLLDATSDGENTPHIYDIAGGVTHQAGWDPSDRMLMAQATVADQDRTFCRVELMGASQPLHKRWLCESYDGSGDRLVVAGQKSTDEEFGGLAIQTSTGTMTGRLRVFGVKS